MSSVTWALGKTIGALMLFAVAGCSGLGKVPPIPQQLDIGAPVESVVKTTVTDGRVVSTLVIPPVTAPAILQGVGVVWRMGPDGAPNRYATYEWSAAPESLVHERLIDRLSQNFAILVDAVSSDNLTLHVNLLQFEQVYAPDGTGNQGVVSVQAVLLRSGEVLGQYRASERVSADSNDAPAGARALRTATNQMADNIATWMMRVAPKQIGR